MPTTADIADLAERYRVRQHPANPGERRTGDRHYRMVHRVKDLVGQVERTVSKSLVEQIVRRGDRADQGVLDREAPGLRPAFADRGDHIRKQLTSRSVRARYHECKTASCLADKLTRDLQSWTTEVVPTERATAELREATRLEVEQRLAVEPHHAQQPLAIGAVEAGAVAVPGIVDQHLDVEPQLRDLGGERVAPGLVPEVAADRLGADPMLTVDPLRELLQPVLAAGDEGDAVAAARELGA